MFTRLAGTGERPGAVTFLFEGRAVKASAGQSVASALAEAGFVPTRVAPSGAPRAAYCMMGVCFECLVVIDGVAARQGCLVPARDGMRVSRSGPEVAFP